MCFVIFFLGDCVLMCVCCVLCDGDLFGGCCELVVFVDVLWLMLCECVMCG